MRPISQRVMGFSVTGTLMRDEKKTKAQLIEGLEDLRRKVAGLEQSATERQEALREEVEKYKALIETTETGYLIMDSEGRVVDANGEYVRLSGHTTLEEIIGRRVVEWTAEHDRERNAVEVARCLQQGFVRGLEIDYVDKEERITPIEIQATVIKSSHSFQILSLCRDITQRKQAEEGLRESEERYRQAIEQSNDGICISKGIILQEVNLKFLKIFGYDRPAEVVGKSIARHIDPLDRERVLGYALKRTKGEQVPYRYEFKGIRKNGESIYLDVSVAKVTYQKKELILTVLRDITEKKRAEDKLRESESKFRQLAVTIHEVFWLGAPDWNHIYYISPAYQAVWGRPCEELYQHPRAWFEAVLEEDRKLVLATISITLTSSDKVLFPNYRIRRPDGSIRWISARAFPIVDVSGQVIRVAGIAEDITERVQAEENLRENREHHRSLMESASNFAIYRLVHDREDPLKLKVVFSSPSLVEIMGVSDPLNFESWFETMHPDDVGRVVAANLKAFETGKFNESYRFFHPQKKEWRWIQAVSTGVLDEEKQTRYVNGILLDITDKKRAEEALQEAYDTLDERVKIRTHQLQIANDRLINEIEERKLIETDLRKSKDKLKLLSNQLINAQENERKRIAIELHDELGQSIVGLKFQLSSFQTKLGEDQKELKQEIKQASDSIDLMTENVRRLSRDLRPSVLEHLGIFEALQWLFEDFSKKYRIKVLKKIKKSGFSFFKEQELIIFRIFQEALANIGKHTQATQVFIEQTEEGGSALFSIRDNGRGFNPKVVKNRNPNESGLGLTAMAERAQMAGGNLEIKSATGKGTLITFSIPMTPARKKAASLNSLK
ncbi:MAG: hypothetical protein C0407_00445 [Desulfobacca sp.]|nr:hypothetical protein [Desulfobacca sp.]